MTSTATVPALPLELGRGWTAGALSTSGAPRLLRRSTGSNEAFEPWVVLSDLAFCTVQGWPATGGRSDLAYDARRGVVYFAHDDTIRIGDVATGETRTLTTAPAMAVDPELEARQLSGIPPERRAQAARTRFTWTLALSPDASELFAVAHRSGAKTRLVRVRVDDGSSRSWEMTDWDGGLTISFAQSLLCFPGAKAGVRLRNFAGRLVAELPWGRVLAPPLRFVPAFRAGAVSPTARSVALSSNDDARRSLSIWDVRADRVDLLDTRGRAPAWSVDGRHVFYVRGQNELRRMRPDAKRSELLVRLAGNQGSESSWASTPVPSPDGRYLLARLARDLMNDAETVQRLRRVYAHRRTPPPERWVRFRTEHVSCVLDLHRRVVQQTRGFSHDVAWASPGGESGADAGRGR